ncbi:MAG: hypothetical protein FJ390_02465 [Verrucomicrobia bacterium]|nr:hypothetical protein [Verrucomicrobiota bacterium]
MKLKLIPLLLSLCLAILPTTLRADVTVTEADALNPVNINKGDKVSFCFSGAQGWALAAVPRVTFSDSAIPNADPNASVITFSGDSHDADANITTLTYKGVNSGQIVLVFFNIGTDPVYSCNKAVAFTVNIKDPAAAK